MPRTATLGASANRGMTLIEVMIVVLIIGVIGSVAVPNVMAARVKNNEAAAVSTMRTLRTSQTQFQQGVRADVDADGIGEFGLLRELSGAAPVRTSRNGGSTGSLLMPALLASSFGQMNSDGEVVRAGYHFKVFLPGERGSALGERSLTQLESSGPTSIDSDLCETNWSAYAWPADGEGMGDHTYFINQDGAMTRSEIDARSRRGANGVVVSEAGGALAPGAAGDRSSMLGQVALDARGRDGRNWQRVR